MRNRLACSYAVACLLPITGLTSMACSDADTIPAGGAGGTSGTGAGTTAVAAGNSSSSGSGGQPQDGGAGGGAVGDGGAAGGGGGAGGAPAMPFQLTSPAFEHVEACTNANKAPCNLFPAINTFTNIGGMNQSPELNWGQGPAGTMSYVVCLHDTSVGATGFTHWCLWNIAAATTQLPANLARQKTPAVPAGSSQDSFSNSDDGYVGPGAKGNVYQFRLYALNVASYTPPNAEDRRTVYAELEADPNGIVLGTSTLRGRANPQ